MAGLSSGRFDRLIRWQLWAFFALSCGYWLQLLTTSPVRIDFYNPGYPFQRWMFLQALWMKPAMCFFWAWGLVSVGLILYRHPFKSARFEGLVFAGQWLMMLTFLLLPMAWEINLDDVIDGTGSNMRALSVSLYSYRIDFGMYPENLEAISGMPGERGDGGPDMLDPFTGRLFGYKAWSDQYVLQSTGPDRKLEPVEGDLIGRRALRGWLAKSSYDPTNGLVSPGDLVRVNEWPQVDYGPPAPSE